MAELPVVREVALSSALARAMDPAAMERLLRAKADEARRALAQAAERSSVTWSFQVARGHVVRASLDSANEVDLLVLGKDNAAPKPSPLRAQRALAVAGPLLLVYDGMPGSESALDTALQLAVANDDELMVVAVTSREHSWAELSEVVSSRMEAADVEGTIQARTLSDVAELVAEVRSRRAKLVLVSRRSPLLDAAAMEFLVNELDCPLALV
jgi:nucleotide-binding universal stress UspA family protein